MNSYILLYILFKHPITAMMLALYLLLFTCFQVSLASDQCETVNHEDPARFQLETFKQCVKVPQGYITTSSGQPVDIRDTNTLNTNLLYNNYFLDGISHSTAERIPERVVHAKGTGALGYFEVTHDISNICAADVFNGIGKKTPVTARFSRATGDRGTVETIRDLRGFGIKFYTKEGNLDLLGGNFPVYVYKDPGLFGHIVRAVKRNPATNLLDPTALFDFLTLRPETLHFLLWQYSDYGIPNTYRHMNSFPIHTFEVVNKHGEIYYVKFNFTTDQGTENLSTEEATRLGTADPDYFTRDLYNAIANGNYPSWTLSIHIMTKKDIEHADFDPFDVTRLWPRGSYKTMQVGRLVLNENPTNNFAQIEQLALSPANLVPGILAPPDKLFEGRTIAYANTQVHRLNTNFNKILVNNPLYVKEYNRDGPAPVGHNMKDTPNYYPNSFNGPIPVVDSKRPKSRLEIYESGAVDLGQASEFYAKILNSGQRQRLVNNLVSVLRFVLKPIQKRTVALFTQIHPHLGGSVANGLKTANATIPLPRNVLYGNQ